MIRQRDRARSGRSQQTPTRVAAPRHENGREPRTVPPVDVMMARAIAPMHKRVLGLAVGITAATAIWLLTMLHVLVRPQGALPIELLAQVFYGFEVTWRGAVIGAWWAFVAGFVAGWFAAFLRNLVVAIWLTNVRIKAHLYETRLSRSDLT